MRRVIGLLVAALSVLVAGGLLDGIVWPGPLLALFRPQLTLALLLSVGVALLVGPRLFALPGVAVAGLGVALLVPAFRDPEPPLPAAGQPVVKMVALNLWRRNDDANAVRELIEREDPDVLALTELTPAWVKALAPVLREYPLHASSPDVHASGVGVFGRARLRAPDVVRLVEGGRPVVEALVDLPDGEDAHLLVVHATSALLPGDVDAHERDLAAIAAWARRHGPRAAVCGDLNAAPWMRSLRDLRRDGRLGATLPGGLFAGSWPAFLPRPLRVAIDGCLVGSGLRARAEVGPRVGSDHLPVVIELGGA